MITLSSKETIRHEVDGVVYLVAVPTMLARAAFRRDVSAMGAVYHTDDAMADCLRDGIRECVQEDQQERLIEVVDSYRFEMNRDDRIDDDENFLDLAEQLGQIESFIRSEYPPYARLEADRGYWLSVAPIIAFRHFVVGWEGGDVTCKRRGGQVEESLLEKIPDSHISAVGWQIIGMMRPGGAETKNSESQSSSQPDPETLTADDSHQTADPAGKSAA